MNRVAHITHNCWFHSKQVSNNWARIFNQISRECCCHLHCHCCHHHHHCYHHCHCQRELRCCAVTTPHLLSGERGRCHHCCCCVVTTTTTVAVAVGERGQERGLCHHCRCCAVTTTTAAVGERGCCHQCRCQRERPSPPL